MFENYIPVLLQCRLFRNMSSDEILQSIEAASPKVISIKKNEALSLPEKMKDIYIILSGRFNVIQDSGMNVSLTNTFTSGSCFGIAFCVKDIPCSHKLHAAEKGELLKLSYDKLVQNEKTRVKIFENLLYAASDNIQILAEKINHTQAYSVRVKISVYLRDQMKHNDSTHFDMDMSRKDMANYLNITYAAMIRELSQMQKEGILTIDGEHVTILDADALIDEGSEYNIL